MKMDNIELNATYLFSRKFKKEKYDFYKDYFYSSYQGCFVYYLKVYTPANAFGYRDIILFDCNGEPYTLYRYCPLWILKACKEALIKKGYGDLLLWTNRDMTILINVLMT